MSKKGHLLMVEDKESLRKMTTLALEGEGYRVTGVGTVADGIRAAQISAEGHGNRAFDLVLSDLRLPDGTGIEVLDAVKRHQPEVPVIMMTAFGTVGTAVEAMKLGAADFLEKPVELDELFALIEQWLSSKTQPAFFQPPGDAPAIVGSHPRLRAALRLVQKVAPLDSTVLLAGESGTGKELFARAVHGLSKRADGPFVAVNCAAIPESLMENERFGHEKGAFTGASQRQLGRFELASGGTLFLDEIGELKAEVQGKVLRVLEEKIFERVGGGRPISTDARVVAATNRNLKEMVATGQFRQDLFYRLEVFPIELPALKDRKSDIPGLDPSFSFADLRSPRRRQHDPGAGKLDSKSDGSRLARQCASIGQLRGTGSNPQRRLLGKRATSTSCYKTKKRASRTAFDKLCSTRTATKKKPPPCWI